MAVGVNVQTLTLLSNRFLKKFKQNKKGGLLIISSVAGLFGVKHVLAYSSTKAFQIAFARGLWDEMSEHNVDVVVSVAGGIRTTGLSTVLDAEDYPPGTQTPEEVALESVSFMSAKGGPVLIPGSLNRLMQSFLQLLPSWASTKLIGYNLEKRLRKKQ
ncbi:short-chain dehydrogenase/reductase family [Acrasis kona]